MLDQPNRPTWVIPLRVDGEDGIYIYIYPSERLFCIVITEIYVGVLPLVVAPADAVR
jgi:hypothetical protein